MSGPSMCQSHDGRFLDSALGLAVAQTHSFRIDPKGVPTVLFAGPVANGLVISV